jgi:hypothetical protein
MVIAHWFVVDFGQLIMLQVDAFDGCEPMMPVSHCDRMLSQAMECSA